MLRRLRAAARRPQRLGVKDSDWLIFFAMLGSANMLGRRADVLNAKQCRYSLHSPALSIAVVKLFDPEILRNFKHLAPPKISQMLKSYFRRKKA